jgi:hypothetical protein
MMEPFMSESTANRLAVISICKVWVADGRGDDCFWEGWPGQPDCANLTPNMVLAAIRPTAQEVK